jgi:L-iditol 2-dehydrogenase
VVFKEACLAEPLANGIHMWRLVSHLNPVNVLIIGAGPIGLLAQQVFQYLGNVKTFVCDVNPARQSAASRLGAAATFSNANDITPAVIDQLTDYTGIDIVIDAVGLGFTQQRALQIVKPGGAIIMIGLHENSSALASYDIILAEKQVFGTYAASQADLEEAVRLIALKELDLHSWIDYYSLEETVTAFNDLLAPMSPTIKAIITPKFHHNNK